MNASMPALLPAYPEMLLAGGAMLLLMLGAFRGDKSAPMVSIGAIGILIVAALMVYWLPGGKSSTFAGSFVVDEFSRFLKVLAFGGSAVAILMSLDYMKTEKLQKFEY